MARKTFSTTIDETLQDEFKQTCKNKNIKMNETLEAIMKAFITGEIDVEAKTTYKVTSKK